MIRRLLYLFIVLSIVINILPVNAQSVVVTGKDKARIEKMLVEAQTQKENTNWMMYFGGQFIGQPYVGGTLDRDTEERLVVNPSEVDCTTYIEYIAALTKCAYNKQTKFDDFCSWLRKLRYLGGDMAYTNRKHYFMIWMEDNQKQGLTRTLTSEGNPFSAISRPTVNWMTTHVSNYKMLTMHPEWLDGIRQLEKTIDGHSFRYIPKSLLKPSASNNAKLKEYIQDGDIIVLMTNTKGLDTAHITMAHWKKDGLYVIHASSYYKKVVDDNLSLYDYMHSRKNLIGICVCRVVK